MKLLTLAFLLSFNLSANVIQGDPINANTFNSSVFNIGSVQQALLTEAEFQDAQGRFIRNAGGNAVPLGQTQEDAFQGHHHNLYGVERQGVNGGNADMVRSGAQNFGDRVKEAVSDGINGTPRISNETRPKNLTLNMFIKINKICSFSN